MKMRRPLIGIFLTLIISIAFGYGAWRLGMSSRGIATTDGGAEWQTMEDAKAIAGGQHSYGIVSYSHYPNGPTYIMAFLIRYGSSAEWGYLRWFPIFTAAICLGFFLFACLRAANTLLWKAWAVIFSVALLFQPGVYMWLGALHEHSYVFSITLLLIGLSLQEIRYRHLIYWIIGFVSGWMGYDYILPQYFSVFAIRLFIQSRNKNISLFPSLLSAFVDALAFASGAAAAVVAHLIQNALYFGDISEAVADLMGSATLRMGLA